MYIKDKARISAGGQALIEGVMMKCGSSKAIAIRKNDGTIEVKRHKLTVAKDGSLKKLPFVRGMFMLIESMVEGGKDLTYSANLFAEGFEDEEESKFDKWLKKIFGDRLDDVINVVSVVLSAVIAIGLFIVLPTVFAKGNSADRTFTVALREGALKLTIFVGYLFIMSQIKDIKRVFQYHGAEHKSIFAYEQGIELNVENVRKMGRLHPRCGTNFMFVVIAISIAIFSFVGIRNVWLRSLLKIAVFPLMAGISYEVIRFAGKHQNFFTRAMVWPGLMMQKITTKEPDDSQLEVAIASLKAVLEDEGIIEREFSTRAEVISPETIV
ncbi:DUF1385 domain-containing protein [Proteocatella sphenisci]|uniref:DUF1385 domain-containing protein n=1 Tax=Proteocatella sphenisci TaxID=181070 RepID=UPI0004B27883|nr:DUF1385 domain-containing protein [Proteocatella sphenisci]